MYRGTDPPEKRSFASPGPGCIIILLFSILSGGFVASFVG
jgi:hypothetical protein